MSKTTLTPVTAMKLTVTDNGRKSSKRVTTADMAADFYAMHKTHEWWTNKGHFNTAPNRYDSYNVYYTKLVRRTLPIFKKYLP